MKKIIVALLIPFMGLVTVQICLKNPKTRDMFTAVEKYENIDYTGIEDYSKKTLTFVNHSENNVELIFNGEKLLNLEQELTKVEVKCDGVFEIKNDSNFIVEITVINNNDNVFAETKNSFFGRGINVLCNVRID